MDTIKDLIEIIKNQPLNLHSLNDRKPNGLWVGTSNKEFVEQIHLMAAYLKSLGLNKGDPVAILAPPSSRWLVCDLAIMLIGCISVPLYSTLSHDNFSFCISMVEAKVIFVGGHECHAFCHQFKEAFTHMISLDDENSYHDVIPYSKAISKGKKGLAENKSLLDIPLDPSDLASVMFTSGSAFTPKGVMISHRSIVCQLPCISVIANKEGMKERFLNFLPLTHIFGRVTNLAFLYFGGCLYYSKEITRLTQDCREVEPTVIIIVPRILEKVVNSFQKKIQESSFIKRSLAIWAFNLANTESESTLFELFKPIADLLLYSKIRDLFGGKLRVCISGSSKADPQILSLFNHMGLEIVEGYGLTEACPVSCNRPGHNVIGTVGKPFPGVELKIASDGEILLKGDFVTKGYYKNDELTKLSFDEEGWFHTRDMGQLDSDGNILFINRFDDRAKTSYGFFIDSLDIERMVNRLPFVNYSVIIANDKPFVSCLIFPDLQALDDLKKQLNLQDLSDQDLLHVEFMKKTVERSIKEVNKKLDEHDHIRAYRFIFDKDDKDNFTLTMKLRRKFILEKYKDTIQEMYPEKIINL